MPTLFRNLQKRSTYHVERVTLSKYTTHYGPWSGSPYYNLIPQLKGLSLSTTPVRTEQLCWFEPWEHSPVHKQVQSSPSGWMYWIQAYVIRFANVFSAGCWFYFSKKWGGGRSTKPHPLYDWSLFSYIMHSHREYKYNIYTNYKVHVLKQSNFPNQEERLSQLLLW